METWQIILAIIIVGLSIVMPIYYSYKKKKLEIELLKNNSDEMNKKLQFIKRKISELEDESNQFQNNLEFFSDSSSDNPLFKNVSTKINTINNKIEFWRKRLNKIEKNS